MSEQEVDLAVQDKTRARRSGNHVFGVCLVSIMGAHQREVRESERVKRKVLNAPGVITCEEVFC
jgi:hypothetical protein